MRFKEGDIVEILGLSGEGITITSHAEPNHTFQVGDFGVVEQLLVYGGRASYFHIRHLGSIEDLDLLMLYKARLYCAERWVWD